MSLLLRNTNIKGLGLVWFLHSGEDVSALGIPNVSHLVNFPIKQLNFQVTLFSHNYTLLN